MANPTASTSLNAETMLLDIEKMTPEKWRALIYNKIVKLKGTFVTDFKTTIIKSIEETMTNVKPDKALESILKGLQMKIKEIKFDAEYHRFIDCIVGVTFEYFCQLIITNSFDNIKRTQNALSCFAVPNNINAAESGSNNNTTTTGEVNLSQLFNNTSSNTTSPILLNDHSSKINNIPLSVGLSGINLANNFIHTAQPSMNSEEDEELKSDSSILSIAMNINEQDLDIKFADDFENDDMNNATQSSKLEEENQIKTSLKLLENLVNIEHNKLEVQKTLAEKNLPQSNIVPAEKKQCKILNKPNSKKNVRYLETPNQNTNKELLPLDTELEKKDLKKQIKSKRKHSHQDRTPRKKSKKSEDLNNTLASDLSTKMQIDKIYSNYNTNSESTKSTSSNIKASINSKETLSKIELKVHSSNIEDISANKKESKTSTMINDSNGPSVKTYPIASTSSYNGEYEDLTNIKSSSSSILVKTTQDYKRIYEEDRKSLFSPDIIFNSKPTKKEEELVKSDNNKHASDKKSKTKRNKVNDNRLIVRITSTKNKMKVHNEDTKPHRSSSKQKYLLGETVKHYKIKKPKKHRSHSKVKDNVDTINENKKLNTTQIAENKELNSSTIILENQESSNEQVLENQDLSIEQSLDKQLSNNEQSLLENQVLNTDSSENNKMPEWIKVLIEYHKIKPCYVVIERNKRY